MEELLNQLREIKGVKTVKKRSGPTLRINLFSREVPNAEAEKIMGNLKSISQNIRNTLDKARKNSEIKNWNWIQKPEKKYRETRVKTEKVNDRKPVGYEPSYYTVSVQEK